MFEASPAVILFDGVSLCIACEKNTSISSSLSTFTVAVATEDATTETASNVLAGTLYPYASTTFATVTSIVPVGIVSANVYCNVVLFTDFTLAEFLVTVAVFHVNVPVGVTALSNATLIVFLSTTLTAVACATFEDSTMLTCLVTEGTT